jgi:hypothetical protein
MSSQWTMKGRVVVESNIDSLNLVQRGGQKRGQNQKRKGKEKYRRIGKACKERYRSWNFRQSNSSKVSCCDFPY